MLQLLIFLVGAYERAKRNSLGSCCLGKVPWPVPLQLQFLSVCYLFAVVSQGTGTVQGVFHLHVTNLRLPRSLLTESHDCLAAVGQSV